MTTEKKCCVQTCDSHGEILHKFPNPNKDIDRFRTWLYKIRGNLSSYDNMYIYKCRRVCHLHFESKYHTRSLRLSPNAIPTLYLTDVSDHPNFSMKEEHSYAKSNNYRTSNIAEKNVCLEIGESSTSHTLVVNKELLSFRPSFCLSSLEYDDFDLTIFPESQENQTVEPALDCVESIKDEFTWLKHNETIEVDEEVNNDDNVVLSVVAATPGDEGETPGDKVATPGDEGAIPGDEGATPGDEGATPGDEGAIPGDEGATPGEEGARPDAYDVIMAQLQWKCDNCSLRLVGQCAVYVCVECPQYRMCSVCGAGSVHEHHYTLRVPVHRNASEVDALLKTIRDHTNINELNDQSVKMEIKEEPTATDNMNSEWEGLNVSDMDKDFLFEVGYDGSLTETQYQGEVDGVVYNFDEYIVPSNVPVWNDDDISPNPVWNDGDISPKSEVICPVFDVGHNLEVKGYDPGTSNVCKKKWKDKDVQWNDDINSDVQVTGVPDAIVQDKKQPLQYIGDKRMCLEVGYIDDLDCWTPFTNRHHVD